MLRFMGRKESDTTERHQERRRGSAEAVLGTSMFSSSETGVSGKFGGRIKGAKYHLTLQDGTWDFPGPMDCSLPGSSIHGIFQA